jgi:hypothetical protein
MKYYYTVWILRDELIEMGATGLVPTTGFGAPLTRNTEAEREDSILDKCKYWVFQADETFPVYAKLKFDKATAEISKNNYDDVVSGRKEPRRYTKKATLSISGCVFDF